MKTTDNLFITTVSVRQNDGSFKTNTHSLWSTVEAARDELKRIKNLHDLHNEKGWRAKTRVGQIDNLWIEQFIDDRYECQIFYSIIEQELKK